MPASDALFLALAQAIGQPSKTYRAAQAGLEIPGKYMEGKLQRTDYDAKLRRDKLAQSPLNEAFGGKSVPGLEAFGDTSVEGMTSLAPAITAGAALEKANREPVTAERNDNLENILAENVRTGKMTLQDAAKLKQSMSPGMIQKPPPGFQFSPDGSTLIPIQGGDPALKRQEDAAKKQAAIRGQTDTAKMVNSTIDNVLKNVGPSTAGYVGSLTRNVAGSPAADLDAALNTVRANVGFEKLQEMRANSPTGGALGAISDRENTLLQSVRGSLEQKQSPEQLAANLRSLRTHYANVILINENQTGDPEADNAIAQIVSSGASENEKRARIQGIRAAAGR